MVQTKEEEQQAASADAVFPVELKIMPTCIFNTKDPIILGCTVEAGIAKVTHHDQFIKAFSHHALIAILASCFRQHMYVNTPSPS